MPKQNTDPILSALKDYEHAPGDKKAALLTPQGGYFLFGNRFCPIDTYELSMTDAACRIEGAQVQSPVFFSILPDGFHAIGERRYTPEMVSLIFRVGLSGDEQLRGILLSVGTQARLAIFCDPAIEEVYRLSWQVQGLRSQTFPPDEMLEQYAEDIRRRDLHGLTDLYLHGEQLKRLPYYAAFPV